MALADETDALTDPAYAQDLCYGPSALRIVNGGFVCGEGVVTMDSFVVAESDTPGQSVQVSPGRAWVNNDEATDGPYFVLSTDIETLEIAPNASGSSRFDTILLRVCDSEFSAFSSAFTLVVNQGTPGGAAPSPPSDGCSYYQLAQILVANGFTTITDANISDSRGPYRVCSNQGPYVTLEATAATSPTGETTVALANNVHLDPDYFTVAANEVTVIYDGLYDVSALNHGNVTSGTKTSRIRLTGASGKILAMWKTGAAATSGGGSLSALGVDISAGQKVRLTWEDSNNAATQYVAGELVSRLHIRKVG